MGWNKIHLLNNCKHNPATHSQINIYIFNFKNNRIFNEEHWFSNIMESPYKFLRNNINMYYDHAIKFISFSKVLEYPMAPGSFPPWPGSITTKKLFVPSLSKFKLLFSLIMFFC